jgi:hypothetical protein
MWDLKLIDMDDGIKLTAVGHKVLQKLSRHQIVQSQVT